MKIDELQGKIQDQLKIKMKVKCYDNFKFWICPTCGYSNGGRIITCTTCGQVVK